MADGLISTEPVAGAERLPGRYTLPGLVDAHCHVALDDRGMARDAAQALAALEAMPRSGVLLVRDIGAPRSLTLSLESGPHRARLVAAGRWLAPANGFYPALHDPVTAEQLIDAALAEVGLGATWVKVVADWKSDELAYEATLLRALVEAVHEAGARVAAHVTHGGVSAAVAAGIDSVEHGCMLDADTLDVMARTGIAWTPTLSAVSASLPPGAPPEAYDLQRRRLDNMRTHLAAAVARGVIVLAGSDAVGTLLGEIRLLVDAGLSPVDALRAATTRARTFLGVPSIEDGAPADVVTFDRDPRDDPGALANPAAVVLGGRRVR